MERDAKLIFQVHDLSSDLELGYILNCREDNWMQQIMGISTRVWTPKKSDQTETDGTN